MEHENLNTPQNPPLQQTAVRRSIPWTQDEIDSLMDYEWGDDSETLDERLEHARYMNHYESGCNYPNRSLSAVRKKFYEECKKRKAV
jgi:hypothetical protein